MLTDAEQLWTAFEEELHTALGPDKDGNPQKAINMLGSIKKNKALFMRAAEKLND